MRGALVRLHRWVGLSIALFLILSGLTGAIISWDHEIDGWLNSHLTRARRSGEPLPPLELAKRIEQRMPGVMVTGVPLRLERGESMVFSVEGRRDPATGKARRLDFNEVFVEPSTGDELGRRAVGMLWPVTRENFVSFLHTLHYTLHLPGMWGVWWMGLVGLVWTIDCFTGLALTLPARSSARSSASAMPAAGRWWTRWAASWVIRWRSGSYKLTYDLHRAASLWTWLLLLTIAFTGFSLALYKDVFFPVMSLVSRVTPSPFETRQPRAKLPEDGSGIGFAAALTAGVHEAGVRGWREAPGSVFHVRTFGIYGVQFFARDGAGGADGLGPHVLYLDADDGRVLGERVPWQGSAADVFVQLQFPLHSGRVGGLFGRILVSVVGLVVAMLSVTGVLIWWRKRRGRLGALPPGPFTRRQA